MLAASMLPTSPCADAQVKRLAASGRFGSSGGSVSRITRSCHTFLHGFLSVQAHKANNHAHVHARIDKRAFIA